MEVGLFNCIFSLNKKKYILTDEYFNDLRLYNESVTMFFRNYEPMNTHNEAIVYLFEDNKKTVESNIGQDKTQMKFTDLKSNFFMFTFREQSSRFEENC